MELQPRDIEVGCVLRPRREFVASRPGRGPHILGVVRTGIPCQWSSLLDRRRKINPNLSCPDGCKLTTKGQKHPIIVIQIKGDDISYVQMTSTPIRNDQRDTQYSPIGHYFPTQKNAEIPHPEKYRSRYWLRGENFSKTTLDEARSKRGYERTVELQKHSFLRLPHVFTQPLSKFEAFGGCNSRAMDYSLDKPSYYRLMDRLSLSSGNDTSDMEYLRTVRPAR
ncbi:hypothetical protein EAF04_004083 [Stromatinia cepivora]|nr:hypothetical protein EAF04_004083 [Stromatinia cepivora]